MKKQKPTIEQLQVAYKQASARRLAKLRKEAEQKKAREKAYRIFKANLEDKKKNVFGPAILKLAGRLDKSLFKITTKEKGMSSEDGGFFCIQAVKEPDISFWIALDEDPDHWENENPKGYRARLHCEYLDLHSTDNYFEKLIDVEKVTEELVENVFLHCLEKIST